MLGGQLGATLSHHPSHSIHPPLKPRVPRVMGLVLRLLACGPDRLALPIGFPYGTLIASARPLAPLCPHAGPSRGLRVPKHSVSVQSSGGAREVPANPAFCIPTGIHPMWQAGWAHICG